MDDVRAFIQIHGHTEHGLATGDGERAYRHETSDTNEFSPKPSAVVKRNGSYDAYWRFDKPIEGDGPDVYIALVGDVIETNDLTYPSTLLPDRETMDVFVDSLFMHASEGYASLRVFPHEEGPPLRHEDSAPVGDLDVLKEKAFEVASWAATYRTPGVFCPPIASFVKPDIGVVRARKEDLVEGYAVSLECDESAAEALKTVRALLGQPTLVVASGGEWQGQPKLHIHYRLIEPAVGEAALERLLEIRRALSDLVGADGTNKAIVHPIRWAGSVHRKGTPKLARIIEQNLHSEIDLDETFEELKGLKLIKEIEKREPSEYSGDVDLDLIKKCGDALPNDGLDWDAWNRLMMAFWNASEGSEEGREAARAWSSKSSKHDDDAFDKRWNHYSTSPPNQINIGTLFLEAFGGHPDNVEKADGLELPEEAPPILSEDECAVIEFTPELAKLFNVERDDFLKDGKPNYASYDMAIASWAKRNDKPPVEAWQLIRTFRSGLHGNAAKKGETRTYAASIIDRVYVGDDDQPKVERCDLPKIKMRAGMLDIELDLAERALAESDAAFQRDGQIVRVGKRPKASAEGAKIERQAGSLCIVHCDPSWLKGALCRTAQFFKWSKQDED
ncbi:MAG: PriCT-2 domain-containing protein, partial [Geminicoccaceae bacterium]